MPRRKELSTDLKDAIVQQYQRGKSYLHFFSLLHSTLHYVINKWKSIGTTINLPKPSEALQGV